MAVTWLTIVDAINSVMDEAQVDVELVYSYMTHELQLHFFKTSNYNFVVNAMEDDRFNGRNGNGEINDFASSVPDSKKVALLQRFKSQSNGTFFKISETEALTIKSYLEDFACEVSYLKVPR
jgi:hypothetical protein